MINTNTKQKKRTHIYLISDMFVLVTGEQDNHHHQMSNTLSSDAVGFPNTFAPPFLARHRMHLYLILPP